MLSMIATYNSTNPTLLEWMGKNRDVVGYMLIELLGSLMNHLLFLSRYTYTHIHITSFKSNYKSALKLATILAIVMGSLSLAH